MRLGDAIDGEDWRKAVSNGIFSHVGLVGKFLLGAGFSTGDTYQARNQDLQLFGGKVFVGPDLGDGPMKFGTSAVTFFRTGTLYRLKTGVSGNKKAASHFARQCAHALTRLCGEPGQVMKNGTRVWWGATDRLTLVHTAGAFIIHELTTGKSQ